MNHILKTLAIALTFCCGFAAHANEIQCKVIMLDTQGMQKMEKVMVFKSIGRGVDSSDEVKVLPHLSANCSRTDGGVSCEFTQDGKQLSGASAYGLKAGTVLNMNEDAITSGAGYASTVVMCNIAN